MNHSPTFAYFGTVGPVCQPTAAQCRRHAKQKGSRPRSLWRQATSAFACLSPDPVVVPLPRKMGGDDGGTTSTHHRRCVRPREDHRMLFPTCPRRGGCTTARLGIAGRGMAPRGITLRDLAVRREPHLYPAVRFAPGRRAAASLSSLEPCLARGRSDVLAQDCAMEMGDSGTDGYPCPRAGSRGPQASTARRRRPRGLAQPAAAVQEGDKR